MGLPQGSELSPVLFLFYINNLAKLLPPDTVNAMFADDVTLLATSRTYGEAEETVQKSVDIVAEWSKEWKISLNGTKSETCYFTSHRKELKEGHWTPAIIVNGKPIRYNPTPRLLGVTLDRTMSFGPHVANIGTQLSSKIRSIACVANSKWGWRKEYLQRIYTANVKSAMHYAGFAWQPCLAEAQIKALERTQNSALRSVTGQNMSTPVEALTLEVGDQTIRTEIRRNAAIAAEKAMRMPTDHPRRLAFEMADNSRRVKKTSWGTMARDVISDIPDADAMSNRRPLTYFDVPPWLPDPNMQVFATLPGIDNKNEEEEKIIRAAYKQIRSFSPSRTIYTDGSASAGTDRGGAGVVTTIGDPASFTVSNTIRRKGARHTSSYGEELNAMEAAAEFILETADADETIVIGTDSQSLCTALLSANRETDRIRELLGQTEARIIVQWMPGHCNIPGNEAADQAAKEAALTPGEYQPTTIKSARSVIKRHVRDGAIKNEHAFLTEVYRDYSSHREKQITSRTDQVHLARIRCGKHLAFADYDKQLHEEVDNSCPRCDHTQHNLHHWFSECPGTSAEKHKLYGEENGDGLRLLTRKPKQSVALARRTLLGAQQ